MLPALGSLSLGLSGGASSSAGGNEGSMFSGPSGGDWNVNLGGSGVAFQGLSSPMVIAGVVLAILGVAWIATRK